MIPLAALALLASALLTHRLRAVARTTARVAVHRTLQADGFFHPELGELFGRPVWRALHATHRGRSISVTLGLATPTESDEPIPVARISLPSAGGDGTLRPDGAGGWTTEGAPLGLSTASLTAISAMGGVLVARENGTLCVHFGSIGPEQAPRWACLARALVDDIEGDAPRVVELPPVDIGPEAHDPRRALVAVWTAGGVVGAALGPWAFAASAWVRAQLFPWSGCAEGLLDGRVWPAVCADGRPASFAVPLGAAMVGVATCVAVGLAVVVARMRDRRLPSSS